MNTSMRLIGKFDSGDRTPPNDPSSVPKKGRRANVNTPSPSGGTSTKVQSPIAGKGMGYFGAMKSSRAR